MHSYYSALKLVVILLVLTLPILAPPSITSITLNSSDNSNRTYANLTAWPIGFSGNNASVIWDWRMTNITSGSIDAVPQPLAAVIIPFERNISALTTGAITDYSVYGNNGTLGGGNAANSPTWIYNATVGGAYSFDGINDYIDLSFQPNITGSSFTYEAWIYTRNYTNATASGDSLGTYFWDSPNNLNGEVSLKARAGNYTLRIWLSGNIAHLNEIVGPKIELNTWQHIAITRSESEDYQVAIYLNGTMYSTTNYTTTSFAPSTPRIGNHQNAGATNAFNGSIGEFRIYNRPLSPEDVATIYNNSKPKYDTLAAFYTYRNRLGSTQKWSVCGTPVNSTETGETVCSNNLTVKLITPIYDIATVPIVNLPDTTMSVNFSSAFKVLDMLVSNYKRLNFSRAYTIPASNYTGGWWEWDQSMHLKATKWSSMEFSMDVVRNFIDNQNQYGSGCIDWTGSMAPSCANINGNYSAMPAYLTSAYEVAQMSNNVTFVNDTYLSLARYYNWFNNTRNDTTGLTTCTLEESIFTQTLGLGSPNPIQVCVDLNAYLAKGAENIAKLALRLGEVSNYTKYMNEVNNRKTLINQYLWNSSNNIYQHINRSSNSSINRYGIENFYPLLSNISNSTQRAQLLADLQDNSKFNWTNGRLLYSLSKSDPRFAIDKNQTYQSTGGAWNGDIWAPTNYDVVKALEDTGRQDLAAHLAYQTVTLFNNDSGSTRGFAEFYAADTGQGFGSGNDGWTSSVFATLLIEDIFGVTYDAADNRITVFPHIPSTWDGSPLQISNLTIPTTNDRLTVNISAFSDNQRTVHVAVYSTDGSLSNNHYNLSLYLPLPFDKALNKVYRSGSELDSSNFSYFNLDDDSDVEAVFINTTLSEVTYTISAVPIPTNAEGSSIIIDIIRARRNAIAPAQPPETPATPEPTVTPEPTLPVVIAPAAPDYTILWAAILLVVIVAALLKTGVISSQLIQH